MNQDISVSRQVLDLLAYGNIHLSADTVDNPYLYRKLCSVLGVPAGGAGDYVPDGDSLEKLTGPERLLARFPENAREALIDALLPLPSKLIELFNSVLDGGNIRDATDWFYDLSLKSGYIRWAASENNIHWQPDGPKGGLHITINTSQSYDNGCHYDYPRRSRSGAVSGGLIERELPIFLRGEDWSFRFSPYNLFPQHFIFYPKNHTEDRPFAELCAALINAAEYFPHYFFAESPKRDCGKCFCGGLPRLPLFSALPRIVFDDPEGFVKIAVIDWYGTVIRLESVQRHAILAAAGNISRAWESFSGGRVSLIARINADGEYCAELILQKDGFPLRGGLIVPGGVSGTLEAAGEFVLPGIIARVAETAYALLTGDDGALEKCRSDADLIPYAEIIADIEAKSSKNPSHAESDIESYIETACEETLKTASAFAEDAAGNTALINFMAGVGLKVKRT